MADNTINEKLYRQIREICIEQYDTGLTLLELLQKIWELPDFPMHCPEHHYLIPAVLLTIYRRYKNDDIGLLEEDLLKAEERARNLLPGFCGWYGACGAAVGSGIFLSLLTDTTPYSTHTWSLANRITADCLHDIAEIGGPRCCKRVSFTSMVTSARFMKEHLGMDICVIPDIACTYYENNKECKKTSCPYYKK
jgi:hypothetical protein